MGYSPSYMTWDDETMGGAYGVPAKAVHLRNLGVVCDNLMSSITHFYHLAAPSYVQGPNMPPWTPYWHDDDYNSLLLSGGRALPTVLPDEDGGFAADLWSAVITQYVKALRIRRLVFEASALFVGRTPFVSHLVAGGVTCEKDDPDFVERCQKFKAIMSEVGDFIVKEYVPVALALGALYIGYDNTHNGGNGWGAGLGNFLCWGNFPQPGGGIAVKGGKVVGLGTPDIWMSGHSDLAGAIARVQNGLREYITYSRYKDDLGNFDEDENWAYPGDVTRTEVDRDKETAYTYLKAPRFEGNAFEVGPMARLYVNSVMEDGELYADTVQAAADALGIVGYMAYVNTNDHATGLKPSMIDANLAVALVRDGLATLTLADGTVVDATVLATLDKDAIVAAYNDDAVITGTVANWVINLKAGISTMDRLRARALESLIHIQLLNGSADTWEGGWIGDLEENYDGAPTFIRKATPTGLRKGFGCIEAPRGALAHFSTIDKGKITAYQCVVPYTWNGSPRATGIDDPGATEKALEGVPYENRGTTFVGVGGGTVDAGGGVEVLRVCQSFDPCIACAVH